MSLKEVGCISLLVSCQYRHSSRCWNSRPSLLQQVSQLLVPTQKCESLVRKSLLAQHDASYIDKCVDYYFF